ncbi:MAG TPA: hypothetical protein VJ850_11865 [Candidatus Limnocylindrales bacterium]|nr:hypothetical protein [Candidatus Limnocylindrales bacterium]
MRVPLPVSLAITALMLAGCSTIGDVVRNAQAPNVRFEVWNRTLDDVTITDGNGVKLEVGACGHAVANAFRVDEARVHTSVGYVFGFGVGGTANGRSYMVLVAADGESTPTVVPPTVIPPCQGHPNAQPGVFLP